VEIAGMSRLTLQVLDGVDRGKVFTALATPVTIGREEGNAVQLNDERVSRYHAKIQEDQGQVVLTDLESTNGTRVNGEPVQLSILRVGDRITLGRSVLLFGSPDQIECLLTPHARDSEGQAADVSESASLDKTRRISAVTGEFEDVADELDFRLHGPQRDSPPAESSWNEPRSPRGAPDLPVNLSPAQAAQLAELLLYLHQRIATATEEGAHDAEQGAVRLDKSAWQRIQRAQMELARYLRRIGHPDE
jgi:pSer/pThr/pTyr-binding forkhead associated (FHA) protein